MQNKAMQDPEIQNILTDPIMQQVRIDVSLWFEMHIGRWAWWWSGDAELAMQVLTDLQENPRAAQAHLKNPGVMQKIQKLVSAGIVQMK